MDVGLNFFLRLRLDLKKRKTLPRFQPGSSAGHRAGGGRGRAPGAAPGRELRRQPTAISSGRRALAPVPPGRAPRVAGCFGRGPPRRRRAGGAHAKNWAGVTVAVYLEKTNVFFLPEKTVSAPPACSQRLLRGGDGRVADGHTDGRGAAAWIHASSQRGFRLL